MVAGRRVWGTCLLLHTVLACAGGADGGAGAASEADACTGTADPDACRKRDAVERGNVARCVDLRRAPATASCYAEVIAHAKVPVPVDQCRLIEDLSLRTRCVARAATELTAVTPCAGFDGTVADACFKGVALHTLNSQLCRSIQHTSEREECVIHIAVETGESRRCQPVKAAHRDDCIQRAIARAITLRGKTRLLTTRERRQLGYELSGECYALSTRQARDTCILGVVAEAKEYRLCKQVTDPLACARVVVAAGDGDPCESYPDANVRDLCVQATIEHAFPSGMPRKAYEQARAEALVRCQQMSQLREPACRAWIERAGELSVR